METLREELYNCIEQFGNLDPRTIKVSQELDILVVEEQRRVIDAH